MRSKKINSLKVITSLKEMQKICLNLRKTDSKKISLIPTMGALHDGHLGLIKKLAGFSSFNNCMEPYPPLKHQIAFADLWSSAH